MLTCMMTLVHSNVSIMFVNRVVNSTEIKNSLKQLLLVAILTGRQPEKRKQIKISKFNKIFFRLARKSSERGICWATL